MSGAPVIMRERTHYVSEQQIIEEHIDATRFLGIYASRPNIAVSPALGEEDRRAEIGFFFKASCVLETVQNGIRGPKFGEMP